MRVLGFDASTTTIGYSVIEYNEINDNIKLIICNYVKPPKDGNLFDRLKKTQKLILDILNEYKPDIIAIEEITQFMAGASTAKTIIALAVFNRTVGLVCYDFLGEPPKMYGVLKIRHGIKLTKPLPKKEEIPDIVSKHLGITFPYVYKMGRKSKKLEIMAESYDMADSLAVAYYCLLDSKKKK